MSHQETQLQLNDYIDGTLPVEERRSVELHLAHCELCRGEADALRSFLTEVRELPRGIAPPRDLWPEIAARIDEQKVIRADFRPRHTRWMTRGFLAAAATVLIALSSGVTAWLLTNPSGSPAAIAGGGQIEPPAAVTALAAFEPAEREYIRTAAELAAILDQRRESLAPETVAVVEENLRIIDQAIAESRAALETDPFNADLTQMLSSVYRQKVDLLQSTLRMQLES